MAIRYSRDPKTGDYLATDTETGIVERYTTQGEWLYASLVRLLQMTKRVEAGLADFQASLSRSIGAPVEDPAPVSDEIEVWP
ncbi:MAG: hypothetical protein QM820_47000 [Minicystis sp.]